MENCAWRYGKEVYVAYAEDIAGYTWTRYHTQRPSYHYYNTISKFDSHDLRMMTFNIQRKDEYLQPSIWMQKPWFSKQRLWRIIDVIDQFQPDILGFQEIHPGMAEAFYRETLGKYDYIQSSHVHVCDTIPNPIMYNTQRVHINDVQILPVDVHNYRIIVKVDITDKAQNTRYVIYNIHQECASHHHETAITLVNDDMKHNNNPSIVLGDFNMHYTSIMHTMPHMTTAYTGTYNSWISWYTQHSANGALIDGIFMDSSHGNTSFVQSEIIVCDDEIDEYGNIKQNKRASDHRPLYADIR